MKGFQARTGRRRSRQRERRKRKKENNRSEVFIPEQIVIDILSRLPIESLPRFTCVSKQWHRLISTISATKKGSPKVLLVSSEVAHSFSPYSINQHQQEACWKGVHVPWTRSYKPYGAYNPTMRCLGSCNGLLLMAFGIDLCLWNPLTRFFKKLLEFWPLCVNSPSCCSGLCYDSADDDYKAVLADHERDFVVVFSVKNKSSTRINSGYLTCKMYSGPTVNAKLHWLAAKNYDSPYKIICLDAHFDKFEEVPMPEPKRSGRDNDIGLGVLDGCLCLSRWDCPRTNVEVSVMKEYGVKKSWTILFTVSDFLALDFDRYGDELVPLGYTKNGEVLAIAGRGCTWKDYRWHIRAFNPTEHSHRRISTPMELDFYPIAYEESLITPTCYDKVEEESRNSKQQQICA